MIKWRRVSKIGFFVLAAALLVATKFEAEKLVALEYQEKATIKYQEVLSEKIITEQADLIITLLAKNRTLGMILEMEAQRCPSTKNRDTMPHGKGMMRRREYSKI